MFSTLLEVLTKINWLLLVGTDGKPDAYTKTGSIDYPSVFLGVIIGIILSVLVALIILISRNTKEQDITKEDQQTDKESEK